MKFKVVYYERVTSTQEIAEELVKDGAQEGTVIQGGTQTHGKGRGVGRSWYSPKGGLWISLILRPDPSALPFIGLLGSYALVRVLKKFGFLEATMKWPNDVFIGKRKIAGILVDASFEGEKVQHAILGIGLNVNNEFEALGPERVSAISMKEVFCREFDIDEVRENILLEIGDLYEKVSNKEAANGLPELIGEKILVQMPDVDVGIPSLVEVKIIEMGEDAKILIELKGKKVILEPF